jgi:hypothetical protein
LQKYLHLPVSVHNLETVPLSSNQRIMAKVTIKKAEAPAKKKASAKTSLNIVKVSESILDKLKNLNLESGLQSDIVWCLGSYRHDQNPVGLLEKAKQALTLFKAEQAKKTKGITAKFISDIESVLTSK